MKRRTNQYSSNYSSKASEDRRKKLIITERKNIMQQLQQHSDIDLITLSNETGLQLAVILAHIGYLLHEKIVRWSK